MALPFKTCSLLPLPHLVVSFPTSHPPSLPLVTPSTLQRGPPGSAATFTAMAGAVRNPHGHAESVLESAFATQGLDQTFPGSLPAE